MIQSRIALVAIARTTFDVELAARQTTTLRARLAERGFLLEGPADLVTDLDVAQTVGRSLAANPPDLLLLVQSTFADSTPVVALAEAVDAPLMLWAFPEPRVGGRLRLNSLCGINLAGHALTLRHRPYDYIYAAPDDDGALSRVQVTAAAGRVRRLLREARLGVVGEHPAGFDSCHLDAPSLRKTFGLQVERIELATVFTAAQSAATDTSASHARLAARLDNLAELDQKPLAGTLGVYAALHRLAGERRLAGLAVRCWPEFFTELGCAACGAMSMLSDEQVPCSCEADVNGTVTQLILQWLSGEPAFGADLVAVDFDQDVAVVWHCGLAPLSMADPHARASGSIHSNRKLPLVMDFPLKPGRVTVARLSRATGALRLVLGSGEMIAAPPSFSGTSGTLRFDRPVREVLDTIVGEGLEHHLSLTYGDHVPALLALAKMLDLPVLRL
jgi:L-fucose isomerase-like protein